MEHLYTIAILILTSSVLSLLCLLVLHFVSPEFKPSWRMISEYALGKYKWLLTMFFTLWSISNIVSAYLYFNISSSNWSALGAILILISGIGALMGGLFDMKHKLHGFSFVLGVPTFPIGASIISYQLIHQNNWLPYKTTLLILAVTVWICLATMAVSMGVFFNGLKKAGIAFGPDQEPLTTIPETVIGVNGYANRLLVLSYIIFNIIISLLFINL